MHLDEHIQYSYNEFDKYFLIYLFFIIFILHLHQKPLTIHIISAIWLYFFIPIIPHNEKEGKRVMSQGVSLS